MHRASPKRVPDLEELLEAMRTSKKRLTSNTSTGWPTAVRHRSRNARRTAGRVGTRCSAAIRLGAPEADRWTGEAHPAEGRTAALRVRLPRQLWSPFRGDCRCTGNGAPGVTRTPDTQFRKLLLYPPELRGPKDSRDGQREFYHLVLSAGPAMRPRAPARPRARIADNEGASCTSPRDPQAHGNERDDGATRRHGRRRRARSKRRASARSSSARTDTLCSGCSASATSCGASSSTAHASGIFACRT
jgi:hypothetical protein